MTKTKLNFRTILSLLLALAMMATLLVLPASAAQLSDAQTSYGFFRSVGATQALEVLNNSNFKSYMHKGDPNDATSLDNMMKGLDLVEETNKKRAEEGLAPFKVTDTLMAMAQANCNYGAEKMGHAQVFNYSDQVLDCLAWGPSTPAGAVESWFSEKQYVPSGANDQWYINNWMNGQKTVGHYGSLTSRGYAQGDTVSGGAFSINPSNQYKYTYNETVGPQAINGEQTYTVEEYRARLQNYMNSVK